MTETLLPTVTVTDDAWRGLLRGLFGFLLQHGNSRKFKARLLNESGSFVNVRYVDNAFVVKHVGQVCRLKPASVALELLRSGQLVAPRGQSVEIQHRRGTLGADRYKLHREPSSTVALSAHPSCPRPAGEGVICVRQDHAVQDHWALDWEGLYCRHVRKWERDVPSD